MSALVYFHMCRSVKKLCVHDRLAIVKKIHTSQQGRVDAHHSHSSSCLQPTLRLFGLGYQAFPVPVPQSAPDDAHSSSGVDRASKFAVISLSTWRTLSNGPYDDWPNAAYWN